MNFVLALSRRAWGSSWDRLEICTADAIPSKTEVWSQQPTEEEGISEKSRVALTEGHGYR
jgi:hypothetical protein